MAKKKILIVDDEPVVSKLLKYAIEKTGIYEVITINESTKALELIRSTHPDLLILDVNMPQLSGTELTDLLKADNALKNIPILFLTANISDKESEKGLKMYGYPSFGKPINMERLFENIEKKLR